MRIASIEDRLSLVLEEGFVDVAEASAGDFGWDPQLAFERWGELTTWAAGAHELRPEPLGGRRLTIPVPRPRQIFAFALNYRDHAQEANRDIPVSPLIFTKFPSCLAAPDATVALPSDHVDWEVELVVVIGRRAHRVSPDRAREHVAGLTIGQDLSERRVQRAGNPPQFSLGKSFPGFGPIGPWLVTLDEFVDPDDLAISCRIGDEVMQHARTSEMIFGITDAIALLSKICVLLPGDLIFMGTPSGVGLARTPQRFLVPGERLTSEIEGIGELTISFGASTNANA